MKPPDAPSSTSFTFQTLPPLTSEAYIPFAKIIPAQHCERFSTWTQLLFRLSLCPLPLARTQRWTLVITTHATPGGELQDATSRWDSKTCLCIRSRVEAHFEGKPGHLLTQKYCRSETLDRLRNFCADKNLEQTWLDDALKRLDKDLVEDVAENSAPLSDLRGSLEDLVKVLLEPLRLQTLKDTIGALEPPGAWRHGYGGRFTVQNTSEQSEEKAPNKVDFRMVEWPTWADASLSEHILRVQPYFKLLVTPPYQS